MAKVSRMKKALKNPSKAYKYLKRNTRPIHLLENPYLFITSRYPIGNHVLERDWDVLIILDTCRVDALRQVSDEYEFIDDVDRIWSLGGTSPEWIAHTFDRKHREELSKTAYITSNPHAKTVLEDRKPLKEHPSAARRFYRYGRWDPVKVEELALYDPVFSYQSDVEIEGIDHVGDVTPPRYITDRAISVDREESPERMIIHYMQPHYPWVSRAIRENRELKEWEKNPNRTKTAGWERVFGAYLDDLRYVLDDVRILLNNIEADKVAISADHGDAFGEWRVFGHGPGRFHPQVRYVPWAVTTASDSGEYEPQIKPPKKTDSPTMDQLEALGYR